LETLLYSPRDTETFCFVHVGKCATRAKIIRLITSAAQKTEIPLRIFVSVEDKLDYLHDSDSANFLDVDLLSETFEQSRRQDVASQVDILGEHQPVVLPVRQAIIDKLQASTDHAHSEVFSKRLQQSVTRPSAGWVQRLWADCVKPESRFTMIKRSIEDQGPWIAMALFWILHSLWAMSIEELDVLLAFEESREQDSDLHSYTDRASVVSLQGLLPGVVDIVDGKALICQPSSEMEGFLAQAMSNHFPHIKSPGIYMAETCLLFLMDYLSEGPFRTKMRANDETSKEESQSGIVQTDQAVHQAASSLAKYAAQHWITHYHLANYRPTLDDKVFSKFVDESTVKGWMEMVISSSGLPGLSYDEEKDNVFRVLDLRGGDQINLFRVLEFCSCASSRPTSTGLLDRLLVLAAELGDQDFLKELCKGNGFFGQEAVVRAIAAAPWPMRQEPIQKPITRIGRSNTADIYLTALQLNNSETTKHAHTALKTQALSPLPDNFVTKAMLIACEYHNEPMAIACECHNELMATACEYHNEPAIAILNDKELSATLVDETKKDSSKWNPLHVAATKGQVEMISRLLSLDMSIEAKTPRGQSPLMLATMHGFSQLASMLVDNSAIVDSRDSSEQIPLHVASQHGFLSITQLLVSKEADTMAQDDKHDTPLHLAVRNGHSEIAKFLIEAHQPRLTVDADNSTESPPAADLEMEYEEEDDFEDSGEEDDDDESVPADYWGHPLDKANSEGATVLLEAAGKDLADIVEALVGEGANPSTGDKRSMTPLHYAAKNGATRLVCYLVMHGAAIDVKETDNSCTPLHLACYYGQTEAAKELLKSDLDLSILDDPSRNPLVAACFAGELRIVEVLLPRYEKEDWGEGLVKAAGYARNDVVEYLLHSGCSPDTVDEYSNSSLHFSACAENASLVQLLLLRRCQVDPKDSNGARVGAYESVKVLTEAGANIELEASDGATPLGIAIYLEKPRTVRLLLAKGAKLRVPPCWADNYSTVLEFALGDSTSEVARIVIEFYAQGKGEDKVTPAKALGLVLQERSSLLQPLLDTWPDAAESIDEVIDGSAGTALHLLALNGDVDQLELLLQGVQSASVNIVAGKYGTVLQAAICGDGDKLEKAKLLLEHRADPSIRGGLHGTALNAAAYLQQNEIVKLLLEVLRTDDKQYMSVAGDNGPPIEAAIRGSPHASSEESTVELLDLLHDHGASPFVVGPYDVTLLHAAAMGRSLEVVRWLLRNRVSADATDIMGRRPMHLAIHEGDLDMVKLLFTSHATLETRDNQGRNGLHYAPISKEWTMTKDLMEQCLQEKDASDFVNTIDVNMWTPLHWACRQSDLDIVSYLIEQHADKSAKTKEK
jgi:ankyrin repeat protein